MFRVYPRACGGTTRSTTFIQKSRGLSPRVRGNHDERQGRNLGRGSIPARAGEPQQRAYADPVVRVYPRACGGTEPRQQMVPGRQGLSPRVRGNQAISARSSDTSGSIPARAGEPSTCAWRCRRCTVYPRACGGTDDDDDAEVHVQGLSPRVRGNQARRAPGDGRPGSIPARAGEPTAEAWTCTATWVYPRACGGTKLMSYPSNGDQGLSPRVRGNLLHPPGVSDIRGSIPARAGEPRACPCARCTFGVYPRACGGTRFCSWACVNDYGLSPRVRGNQGPALGGGALQGSIPARAGEPPPKCPLPVSSWVYPRACGGTDYWVNRSTVQLGLSPRVRGNRTSGPSDRYGRGSIPARAGEPDGA